MNYIINAQDLSLPIFPLQVPTSRVTSRSGLFFCLDSMGKQI